MSTAVGFLACRDFLAAPRVPDNPSPLHPTDGTARASAYPHESPGSKTIPLIINDTDGQGRTDPAFDQPWYLYTTVVKAHVTGTVTRTPNYAGLGSVTTYGPVGRTSVDWHDNTNSSVVSSFTSSDTRYINFTNNTHLDGGGWDGLGTPESHQNYVPPGQSTPITCGPLYSAPLCATFSGSASITITRLESSLNLVADSTNVVPGSVVHFSALANPTTVEGQTMPVEVDSSTWRPDSPAAGGEPSDTTTPCGFGLRGNTCTRTIIGSGTLWVVAYVNGKRQEGTLHITTPTLTLTASPAYMKAAGNVTFTPQWSDGHSTVPDMWSWAWTADSPPGHTSCGFWEDPCTKQVQETGKMKVQVRRNNVFRYATTRVTIYSNFSLVVDRTVALPGEPAVFTPLYDGTPGPAAKWQFIPDTSAGDHTACANGVQDCVKPMQWSGTMWAYSALASGDSDHKHVSLVPLVDTSGGNGACASKVKPRFPAPVGRGRGGTRQIVDTCAPTDSAATCPGALYPKQVDSLKQQYVATHATRTPNCDQIRYEPAGTHWGWLVVQSHSSGTSQDPIFHYAVYQAALDTGLTHLYADTAFTLNTGNRIYSTPNHNMNVPGGGRPDSRHVYGDAADIQTRLSNPTSQADTVAWYRLRSKAKLLSPRPCAEPLRLSDSHLHIDFRKDPAAVFPQSACPTDYNIP